jgi:hypothetical protein
MSLDKIVEGQERNMERAMVRYRAKRTRRLAIRAFCVHCMGGDLPGVKTCPSKGCALWRYRMGAEVKV